MLSIMLVPRIHVKVCYLYQIFEDNTEKNQDNPLSAEKQHMELSFFSDTVSANLRPATYNTRKGVLTHDGNQSYIAGKYI